MKYWLLTTEYPPFYGGGISTYCYFTGRMLAEKGHEVSVFINDAAVSDFAIDQKDNIRIIRFNPSRTNSSSFLGHTTNISYEFAHAVKHFIEKEGRPDVIEAQDYQGIAYYLLQYKYLLYDWCKDVPVIITMHSPSFLYLEYNHVATYTHPNYWIGEMERFCLQACNLLISPSEFMLHELAKRFKLTNTNVAVIPNPFEIKQEDIKPLTRNENEMVFYGKLTVQKGALKLFAYFKKLWDEGFTKSLHVIGGQDIIYHPEGVAMGDVVRRQYKKYIQQGLLILEGRLKPAELSRRLSTAQVVIIPSLNDNLPYVLFEMMELGKIVLISKQGGQAEVVEHGKDGFIFDHDDPETFSQQLKNVLELGDEERMKISENAVLKVRSFSAPETVYAKKIDLVQSLLQHGIKKDGKFPVIREPVKEAKADEVAFKKGLLSIVIPYYNLGNYLDETMNSLLQVNYPNKEIIIVNDGSNEHSSLLKLDEYRNLPGTIVIDTSNNGLARARNLGAEKANGEYLAFLDADDTVGAEYYSIAIRIFEQYDNIFFAGCWTKYFDDSIKVWPTFTPEPPLILYHNLINSSALVYKRNAFLTAGRNDANMPFQGLEDYDSVISMLENGFNGVVIPEILFYYRVRRNSMIRKISKSKRLYLDQYLTSKHRGFYATFATDIFNLLKANGADIDNPSSDYHLSAKLSFAGPLSGKIVSLIKKNRRVKIIAYKLYRLINK